MPKKIVDSSNQSHNLAEAPLNFALLPPHIKPHIATNQTSNSANIAEPFVTKDTAKNTIKNTAAKKDNISPHSGHRARLRARYLSGGENALADYELLELLLFGALPQKDTKPLAKELLQKFGSLKKILQASSAELQQHYPNAPAIVATLSLAGALARRMAEQEITGQIIFSAWQQVLDYCRLNMADLPHEEVRLLFLDSKNVLIGAETHQRGTTTHTAAYPREIVKRALEKHASALILVHNHPSGNPTPSAEDISLTREVQQAAGMLGIALHDHLIIGKNSTYCADNSVFSFKAEGLI